MRRDKARVAKLVRQAKKELGSGNRDDALALLKKALALDPDSDVVIEEILQIESELTANRKKAPARDARAAAKPRKHVAARAKRTPEAEAPAPAAAGSRSGVSPTGSGGASASITDVLRRADEALLSGDEQAARNALRRAKSIDPDSSGIPPRLRSLSALSNAGKLVERAMKDLDRGDPRKALAGARKAFDLAPALPSLGALLDAIGEAPIDRAVPEREPATREAGTEAGETPSEVVSSKGPAPRGEDGRGRRPGRKKAEPGKDDDDGGAEEYVRRVREKVQISALVDAAALAREGLKHHPGHELLATFVEKFDKMGL